MRVILILSLLFYEAISYKNLICKKGPHQDCSLVEKDGIEYDNLTDVSVSKGEFERFSTHYVSLDNFTCDYIPAILKELDGLKQLYVKNCGKVEFKPETLFNSNIKSLIITESYWPKIEGNPFKTLENIQNITLPKNQILEVSKKVFDGLKNLSSIDLSHNGIQALESDTFSGIVLDVLNLSHNNITSIMSNAFNASNLKVLDLGGNRIKKFEFFNDNNLSSLEILDLSGNLIEDLDKKLVNLNSLKYLSLEFNKIEELKAETFEDLKELIFLNVADNKIDDTKLSYFRFAPKLEHLQLSKNKITLESGVTFFGYENLKTLNVSNNLIKGLAIHMFADLAGLKGLDLSGNLIGEILEKAFVPLKSLEVLILNDNKIKNLTSNLFNEENVLKRSKRACGFGERFGNMFTKFSFGCSTNNDTELVSVTTESNNVTVVPVSISKYLREIYLRNNEILEIAIETFKPLDQLTILDLSNNRLTNLQAGTFDLKNLEVLILSENQLQSLSTNLFEGAGKLQSLSLDSNNINEISAFNELDNLRFMNLSHNAIKKINFGVFKLPALNTLNLSNNEIHTIEEDAFLEAINLTDLDLSNNKLMKIGSGMFTGLVQLKIFNLKNNQIKEIVKFPNQLKNLQNLTLSLNNLTDLDEETFSELSGLEKLDLSYNQLESIRAVSGMKSLVDLSLEGNKIKNINSGQFQDLTSLKKLNLRNNQINETGNEDFKGLESLNILILSGNPIKKISESVFLDLKNLTELYLDGKYCFKRNFSLTEGALKNLKICPRNFDDEIITEESEDFKKMSMETLNYLIIIGIILIVLTIGIISAILYRYKKLKETSDSNPAEKGIYYNNEHEKLSNPI